MHFQNRTTDLYIILMCTTNYISDYENDIRDTNDSEPPRSAGDWFRGFMPSPQPRHLRLDSSVISSVYDVAESFDTFLGGRTHYAKYGMIIAIILYPPYCMYL